jgi:hypothetical protein
MSAYSNHMYELYWDVRSYSDNLAEKNNKTVDGWETVGSVSACNPSGWLQTEISTMWSEHFVKYMEPTPEQPVALLLNTHTEVI